MEGQPLSRKIPLKMKDVQPDLNDEVQKIMLKLREADRNKDGSYSKDELKNALKDLGAIFPGWRANRCFGKADADNDGQISGDEIDTLLQYLLSRGYGN